MVRACWPRAALLATLTLVLAAPGAAHGSPFEDGSLGGDPFTGPTHAHPSSIYVNPAALGLALPGWHVHLGGSVRLEQLSVDRQLIDVDSGAVTQGPSASALTPSLSGMFAGYYRGTNAAFGLATFTPMAERFPRDVEAFRYHTLGGHHYQWNVFALSGSVRWNKFWFGLALGLGNMQSLRLRFARDTALEAGTPGLSSSCGDGNPECGVENDAAAQRYRVDVASEGLRPFKPFDFLGSLFSADNLTVYLGALYVPREDWIIALSYQGRSGFTSGRRLSGTVRVEGADIEGGVVREGEAEIGYGLPQTFNLAVRTTMPGADDFDAVASLRWQTFSAHGEFDVRMFGSDLEGHDIPEQYPLYRGFRDVFRQELGIERKSFHPFRFGTRLHIERGAVASDEATPLSADGFNIGAGAGIEWRLGTALVLNAGYNLTWFPTMSATTDVFNPIDRRDCVDSGYELGQCAEVREGRARPTAAGDYTRLLHRFSTSVRWDFL